ncbi:alpha/beta hydrolase [Sphingobium sp. Sx8-8]|uniref:alpha/beta fold hydrolase n=1 Tax=Sphingobium sp. Sx8-8 TaxID=2933617 RepID=UPI001F56AF14|nr:alpha/beta hydrolase [Sphingobium sp. Sx8-8]
MPVEDYGPTSHHFVSQRLRLHYLDWGNADAPTLILLHGNLDHARSWDDVARALRHDWHVVCPDLRGHGDSAWSPDGAYSMPYFTYDLAQFIRQLGDEQVTIVAHSMGGAIAVRYSAIYPEKVRKLVSIEGLGPSPTLFATQAAVPATQRWREWLENRHAGAALTPRRYPDIDTALKRMREANAHLTEAQARHLTIHGVIRNEDGSYGWKFDPMARNHTPVEIREEEQHALWNAVECPVLLVYGKDSWASNPEMDGRASHFRHARTIAFDKAGHWVHHDRLDGFLEEVRSFI